MSKPHRIAVAASALLLSLCSLAGEHSAIADTNWTGGTSQDWFNAANWDNNVPGNANNDAFVNIAAGNYPLITAGAAVSSRDIRIATGGLSGRLDQTGGTLATGDGSWFWHGYQGGAATYNLADTAAAGGTYTGFGVGSGSVNVGGALQNGNLLAGLDNNTVSTVNVNTTGTFAAGGVFLGANGGSTGNFNLDNGTVTLLGEMQIGSSFFGNGGIGNLNVSGGSLSADIVSFARGNNNAAAITGNGTITGGTVSSRRWFTLGFAGNASNVATVSNNGGTVNVNTDAGGPGVMEMGVFDGTQNTFNANTGSVNLQNNAPIGFGQGGNHTGVSTFNQNGGTVTFYSDGGTTAGGTGSINLGNGGSTGTYAYNLNGGTLTVPKVQKTGAGASGTFNFNGGTLKPTVTDAAYMTGLTRANVRDGGAKIDTNGFDVTIGSALEHSNVGGDNAVDGGLVKDGIGTLTLAGINTYTGSTSVNAGTLSLADNAGLLFVIGASGVNNLLTGVGTALLDGDFTFDLTGASTTLGASWSVVNVATLAETFGSTFTVNSFAAVGSNLWTQAIGGGLYYQFSESTGVLQVVPEPGAALMLGGLSALALIRRRARVAA